MRKTSIDTLFHADRVFKLMSHVTAVRQNAFLHSVQSEENTQRHFHCFPGLGHDVKDMIFEMTTEMIESQLCTGISLYGQNPSPGDTYRGHFAIL